MNLYAKWTLAVQRKHGFQSLLLTNTHDQDTQQKLHILWRRLFLKNITSFDCLHPCQPEYEQACFCAYVSIFACLHLGVCVCGFKRCPDVLSCVTQFWSSLSFLPGPVLVFRAPPEGPLARWERCWRRPGPAVLLPSPSTGCQAQRVPLASQAWRWGCLHSQRRVWTGQGVATSCWTHTCRKAYLHTQIHTYTNFHKADSWWVRHMFGRHCGGESKCVESNLTEPFLQFVQVRNIRQTLLWFYEYIAVSLFWVMEDLESNIGHGVHTFL